MSSRPQASLAQRKRQLVADELSEAALQLLALKGFDVVTVDEIVTAAGVSKRTFFRYFASKEDVVVQFLTEMGAGVCSELAARPGEERPSTALKHAVSVPLAACTDHSDRALRVVQLILRTPALHARFLERQAQWHSDLTSELARRQGLARDRELYPQMAAGMALTAFNAVLQRWSDSDGAEDPAALTDRAFAVIAPALDAIVRT
ncbi:TetR family transcriptional regulator [Streptomyces ambofaciens]|uniref:Putative TetR-family transcriptional regulator n=1 Tax=Streptomyces ambofaciens TaxID=1889 RepID=Q0JW64_STRAM|nr:TetR family transcriptional regulator [Streptomyces ambofaciens]ANB10670.1 TetR family transcriptional regulator [Streptomyces ambofaciens]CAK51304.1 putative TetR-family transcriptional regulator [Streptomyces ambofaciens]